MLKKSAVFLLTLLIVVLFGCAADNIEEPTSNNIDRNMTATQSGEETFEETESPEEKEQIDEEEELEKEPEPTNKPQEEPKDDPINEPKEEETQQEEDLTEEPEEGEPEGEPEEEEAGEEEEGEEEEPIGTGVFVWPVEEREIIRTYGQEEERGTFCKGIGILTPKGAPVYAADRGVVVLSGFRAGYGNVVAINHRNDYTTYYGYNYKNLVDVGDIVEKGQKIAEVGNTGSSPTPLLHFEIRINNETVNPLDYLP